MRLFTTKFRDFAIEIETLIGQCPDVSIESFVERFAPSCIPTMDWVLASVSLDTNKVYTPCSSASISSKFLPLIRMFIFAISNVFSMSYMVFSMTGHVTRLVADTYLIHMRPKQFGTLVVHTRLSQTRIQSRGRGVDITRSYLVPMV